MLAVQNLPESSFEERIDVDDTIKPAPQVSNKASFKSFAIRVGLFVAILITVFGVVANYKSGAAPKPTSLGTFDQKDQSAKPTENTPAEKPSSPDDEDNKKSRRKSGDMLTDSGDDGKEPPNGNEWRFIERKNVESGTGVPVMKAEADKSDTKSETSEQEKPVSSDEETLDEREEYEAIRGPDVKGVDPRSTEIGSAAP